VKLTEVNSMARR